MSYPFGIRNLSQTVLLASLLTQGAGRVEAV